MVIGPVPLLVTNRKYIVNSPKKNVSPTLQILLI